MLNLQSIIEKTLAEALPGMIQARIASGLEQAVNPAIDRAIASILGVSPKRVVAAPVAKPSSQVKLKAIPGTPEQWAKLEEMRERHSVKVEVGKPAFPPKTPTTPKAKAKAKAKPAVPSVVKTLDHKEMFRETRCVKAHRRYAVLDSCVVDVATREKARASRFCRVTPLSAPISSRDAEMLQTLGFRCRVDSDGKRVFLGNIKADSNLDAKVELKRY